MVELYISFSQVYMVELYNSFSQVYMVELYNDQLLDLFHKSHAAKLDIKKDKKGAFYQILL